jgi:hypothetical protein
MKVKDLMVPIEGYANVKFGASLYDALIALRTAQDKLPEGKAPHQAVLVEDDSGHLVGKIGYLVFIKALGAEFYTPRTREEMDRAGISPDSISTVMSHMQFFHEEFGTLQQRAHSIKAREVMHPIGESIDENAGLQEAIDVFGALQTLSVLVRRGGKVVGVLRLSDLFEEMSNQILSPAAEGTEE